MSEWSLVGAEDTTRWNQLVDEVDHDVYHLPEYHHVECQMHSGDPFLFHWRDADVTMLLPFVKRQIPGSDYCDATSVYGYPGLIGNLSSLASVPNTMSAQMSYDLLQCFRELGIISFFGRFHPIFDHAELLSSIGKVVSHGPTVAVDLSLPPHEQVKQYRKVHRYDIRKAEKLGVHAHEDPNFVHLDRFIAIYNETMDRVGASRSYYFSTTYFEKLVKMLPGRIRLFYAECDGAIVSASLFFFEGDVIQYHLSGTSTEHRHRHSGVKLLLDRVRQIGVQQGYRWFHLGGGIGARQDSLYDFKRGFSRVQFQYRTVRVIAHENVYDGLTERHKQRSLRDRRRWDELFFPVYRQ